MLNFPLPLFCLTLLVCCVSVSAHPGHAHPPAAPHTLREKDANHVTRVKVGDEVIVRLISNPSTGFGWEVAQTNAKILPVQGKTEFVAAQTEAAGAPGLQIWRFKAIKKGQVKLELVYHRPWEKKPPYQVWRATVDVR